MTVAMVPWYVIVTSLDESVGLFTQLTDLLVMGLAGVFKVFMLANEDLHCIQ